MICTSFTWVSLCIISMDTYITGAYLALSNNMIKALYNVQIRIILNYIYIALKTYF